MLAKTPAWPIAIYPGEKRPIGKNWGKERATEGLLREIFTQYPDAGLGFVMGCLSGMIDMEVDDPEKAADPLARIFPNGIPLTAWWLANRGPHYLMLFDTRLIPYVTAAGKGKGVIKDHPNYPGIEFRIGTLEPSNIIQVQSVVPPTPRADGSVREWHKAPLASIPDSVFADFDKYLIKPAPMVQSRAKNGKVTVGRQTYGQAALKAEIDALSCASPGTRNDQLNRSAFSLAQLVAGRELDINEVDSALVATARSIGLADDEIARTIASAFTAGMAEPRSKPTTRATRVEAVHPIVQDEHPVCPEGQEEDPHRLGRTFLAERRTRDGELTFRYFQDTYLEWIDGAYRDQSETELRAEVTRTTKADFDRLHDLAMMRFGMRQEKAKEEGGGRPSSPPKLRKVTRQLVSNVIQAIGSETLVKERMARTPPVWLGSGEPFEANKTLPTRNCLVNLPALVQNLPGAIHPPTPRFFTRYALNFDFDANAPEPTQWLTFLGARPLTDGCPVKLQVWPDLADRDSIELLQEWFGYNLLTDTSQQKIMLMVGAKRAGKGTIARILRELVGPENCVGPTVSGLAGSFGLEPLLGKQTAIISDARMTDRDDVKILTETFLAISGEDPITIPRKHRSAVTGFLPTRFTVISNDLPKLTDSSATVISRFLVLRFKREFYGKEDPGLTSKLKTELPGILLWAIEGWRRLAARGYFLQPKSGVQLLEELEDLSSPIKVFIRERCDVEAGRWTSVADLYAAWVAWSQCKGRKHEGDETSLGRAIRSAVPHVETKQRRVRGPEGPAVVRGYEGIGIKGT